MLTNQAIKLKRLQKQQQQLIKQPISNVLVKRDGLLDFHFVIYQLDGDYQGGFYHGLLQLHENYPFAAPKLFFYTPSGRFQINTPICTSFTNYHQESWTSAWNVRSLLLGTVSFMTSNEASYGCRMDSSLIKKQLAAKSMQHNLKNPKFRQLFLQQLKQNKILLSQLDMQQSTNQQIVQKNEPPLINENQHILIQNQNQRDQQNRNRNNKCKKILKICAIVIPIVALSCYLILK